MCDGVGADSAEWGDIETERKTSARRKMPSSYTKSENEKGNTSGEMIVVHEMGKE